MAGTFPPDTKENEDQVLDEELHVFVNRGQSYQSGRNNAGGHYAQDRFTQ
jgi:hypothetical protein